MFGRVKKMKLYPKKKSSSSVPTSLCTWTNGTRSDNASVCSSTTKCNVTPAPNPCDHSKLPSTNNCAVCVHVCVCMGGGSEEDGCHATLCLQWWPGKVLETTIIIMRRCSKQYLVDDYYQFYVDTIDMPCFNWTHVILIGLWSCYITHLNERDHCV